MSFARCCLLLPFFVAGCHYHNYGDTDDAAADLSDGGGGSQRDLADAGPVATGGCMTVFRYHPPAGMNVGGAAVAGEFNQWKAPGIAMAADGSGGFTATVPLAPGLYAYKLIIDGNWVLDPASTLRKYVDGVENSAVTVADCGVPLLALTGKTITRASVGQGHFAGVVSFQKGQGGSDLDPTSLRASLRAAGVSTPLPAPTAGADGIHVDAAALADGKYTIFVDASDKAGHAARSLRLVFWIEAEAFDWEGAVIYMVMTDRFSDGDKSNNAPATAGVDKRVDYQGGDLQGITAQLASGYFDQLGVRALWISPFHQNPAGAYAAADGSHQVTGYHGYWPIRARNVEPRLGGDAALAALVAEAHKHGIRVLQDFVVNHVHKEHEYFKAHPDWFRTGCVCGTNNCDWTTHRLDCLFADYLPDVNWTVPAVSAQYGDDMVYWLDHFDLDGLRVDAVKHVEDAAVMNLATRVRGEFEAAGTRVFMTGETAMGWSDCGACNADQYATIARYIGPMQLDGQADFVLYHSVPYRVYSSDEHGMLHADYWTGQSQVNYPAGAVMTPFVGSQDTARFVTLASYRGQDQSHDPGVPGNQWDNIASAPPDAEPYGRLQIAQAWLMTLPGAPMMYYGDEYGEWGGADPNNRVMWRGTGALSSDERATLASARALGQARKKLSPLRRGSYISVYGTEAVLLYARQDATGTVLVALNRTGSTQTFSAPIPAALNLPASPLHDQLGGPDVTIKTGMLSITLPPRKGAIYAP